MNGGPKDNANPIILDIEKKKKSRSTNIGNNITYNDDDDQQPMYYNELIQSFRISNNNKQSSSGLPSSSMISMDDYASILSLKQTAIDSNNECISLLKKLDVWNHDNDDHDNNDVTYNVPHRKTNIFDHVMLFQEQKQQHDIAISYRKRKDRQQTKNDELSTIASTSSTIESSDSYESNKKNYDTITADEVFEVIRTIQDPEHPLTLEQLGVVSCQQIVIHDAVRNQSSNPIQQQQSQSQQSICIVRFTPTIPHCSMATLIGLCIRVKLLRSLPIRFKMIVMIEPGTHSTEHAINKQLADKERVCAALENTHLLGVVNKCIKASDVNQ